MDQQKKRIWGRGNALLIIWEARWDFLKALAARRVTAGSYTSFSVAHYSLVKRYVRWFQPLAAWHLRWATFLDGKAIMLGLENAEQADIVSRHLAQASKWKGMGGDLPVALAILYTWLYHKAGSEAKQPHTRPNMLITLRNIEWSQGREHYASDLNDAAWRLIDSIVDDCQRVRVMGDVGFWEYDHKMEKSVATKMIWRAIELAEKVLPDGRQVSKDQAQKLRAEWVRRGGI